jgi:2',3'-cyclic-nucleotide 2'-phosphodiesterase (5'-nucleotidase family)
MRLFFRRPLLLLAALLLLGLPGAAAAETLRLTFLHVNDVYGHAPSNGEGGLAELGTMLERERAAARGPVFTTFGGDLISPSLASSMTQGRHMIGIFNALGTDVAVLGNHEFDFGPEVARQRIGESRFPWLGANVLDADGRVFGGAVASVLRQAGGMTVGFVGVLTETTAELATTPGLRFAPALQVLRREAAALRAQGAELVVALTHLDLAEDREAQRLPGVDLVLGGHDHDPAAILENGVLMLKAGSDARWLGVVELEVERGAPGQPARIRRTGWRMLPNAGNPPHPAIAPLVAAVEAELDTALGQPLVPLLRPLDSRTAVVRTREAALGNVVADALRAHFGADVALMNGGGLRGNREYPAGSQFTRRDLLGEMPFGNAVVMLELDGATLAALLEHGLSQVADAAGRFPQLSGVTLRYDPRAEPGHRLRGVEVGGQPLDPARRYRLATTDYLQRGGDGYDMLPHARVLVDASGGPLLVNVVAEALLRGGPLAAVPEGRVVATP